MKWLKRLGILSAILIAAFVALGLALPTTYTVSHTVEIHAPRATVHALVSDLAAWPRWEPWTQGDPTIVVTRGEQTTGVGAHQAWSDANGGGELTFTRSDPEHGVAYDLIFGEKYRSRGELRHRLLPDGGTEVTWIMTGQTGTPVVGGYFAKIMRAMIQPMFERGMAKLKAEAEAAAEAETSTPAPAPSEPG